MLGSRAYPWVILYHINAQFRNAARKLKLILKPTYDKLVSRASVAQSHSYAINNNSVDYWIDYAHRPFIRQTQGDASS